MLDVPLALLCPADIIVPLGINQTVQAVLLREAVGYAVPVFPGTSGEVRGGTDIQGAVWAIGHDVNPAAPLHGDRLAGYASNPSIYRSRFVDEAHGRGCPRNSVGGLKAHGSSPATGDQSSGPTLGGAPAGVGLNSGTRCSRSALTAREMANLNRGDP